MKRVSWGLILFLFIVMEISSQAQSSKSKGKSSLPAPGTASSTPPGHSVETSEEYVIGPEDGLAINVWKEPELSTSVVVRPDGKITLPLVNELQASGLTAKQLQEKIAEKLKDYVASPVVTVMVREIKSHTVIILGEVGKAGSYPFGSPLTVVELIGRAGGFKEYAKTGKIKIIRKEGDRQVRFNFNYKDYIQGKNPEQNIVLKNGDVVIVP